MNLPGPLLSCLIGEIAAFGVGIALSAALGESPLDGSPDAGGAWLFVLAPTAGFGGLSWSTPACRSATPAMRWRVRSTTRSGCDRPRVR